MKYYPYGEKEMTYLSQRDPKLGEQIARIGKIEREVNPDIFSALVSSIIDQQLSGQAAAALRARLVERAGELTPEALLALSVEDIRSCGLSEKKAESIWTLAQTVEADGIDLDELYTLPDETVVQRLTLLPGIGRWTAEMVLIFSMCRPDVVSFTDNGIKNGMMALYGLEWLPKKNFEERAKVYSPYGTVASFYLWQIARERGRPEE